MIAVSSFQIQDLPSDPYEAEAFLVRQIKLAFEMMHDTDVTAIKDFAMVREMNARDPFGKTCTIVVNFEGDTNKTQVRPWGETQDY